MKSRSDEVYSPYPPVFSTSSLLRNKSNAINRLFLYASAIFTGEKKKTSGALSILSPVSRVRLSQQFFNVIYSPWRKKSFTEKYLNAITWKINSNPSRKQRIWVRSCVFVTRNKSNQLSSFEPFIDSFRALYIEFFLQFVFKQKINNKPTVFKPCFVINLLSFWVNNEVV